MQPPPSRDIVAFVRESNRIEGIHREPTDAEIDATCRFLVLAAPTVADMRALVSVYQPNAVLRDMDHLNVRVGKHIAPKGGASVVWALEDLLIEAQRREVTAYDIHCRYEHLHPFTDGNGRSGRALWAWMMVRRQQGMPLGFLHQFYYQTLAAFHTDEETKP